MLSDKGFPIAERLSHWLRIDPGAPAIGAVDGPMLSRAELSDRMLHGRGVLREAGLRPADRVALLLPEGLQGAIAALQVAAACSVAPLRPSMGTSGWATALRQLSPSAIVVSSDWPEAVDAAAGLGIRVFHPDELGWAGGWNDPGSWADPLSPAVPELLLATSGSTGPPKWVRIPQGRMVVGSTAMSRCMRLTPEDRALLALPLTHAHGLASGLLLPLLSGGSVVVAESFDPGFFLKAVYGHSITWFTLPPAMHRAILEQHAETPLPPDHQLRFVRSGTVTLPPAVIESLATEFGVPVIEAYGMTESPHIACNPADSPRAGSVGRPVIEELAVVGSDFKPVPAGRWGQVALRGAPLMTGYLDSTAGAAGAEMFRDGWFQTGDEGRLDEDGYLFLRGRIGERINRGGAMVAPVDVDAALLTHPAVREAVSFPVAHPSLGEDLASVVVLTAGLTAEEAELRRYLTARLEPRQVPSRIVAVDAIPLGAAGKVSRATLAESLAGVLQAEYEPGLNPVEKIVIECFAAALDSRLPQEYQVGRSTNFFLAGGDSLAATQCMTRLARGGWGERPPTFLFENPTPAAVAEALVSAPPSASHLVTLAADGDREPLIVVHGQNGHLFHYLDLARALAPHRPVLGLQNTMMAVGDGLRLSVDELGARYADDILRHHSGGPIHLLGYSAGGWYAWAVAAALHDRGVTVGLCAILDAHVLRPSRMYNLLPASARNELLARRVVEQFRRLPGRQRVPYLVTLIRRKLTRQPNPDLAGGPDWIELVSTYAPPQLPIEVDLFGPALSMRRLRLAWRNYAIAGFRCHPMFENHRDMVRADLMPHLAAEIESALAQRDSSHGTDGLRESRLSNAGTSTSSRLQADRF